MMTYPSKRERYPTPHRIHKFRGCVCSHEDWQHGLVPNPLTGKAGCVVSHCQCPGVWYEDGWFIPEVVA